MFFSSIFRKFPENFSKIFRHKSEKKLKIFRKFSENFSKTPKNCAIVKQRALERQEKDKKRLEEKLAAKNAAAEEQRVKLMEEKIKLDILRKENDARNRFKKEVAKTSHPVAAIKFGPNFNVNNKKGMF